MTQTKAIIFDCFGVLYPQATGAFFEKHKEQFSNSSEALDDLNLKIDLGKINRAQFFAGLEASSGIPASEIQEEIDSQLIVDNKLITLIKRLKHKYKIGLLSNAGEEEIAIIYRDKIDFLFDVQAVSYEVGSVKPDAALFITCTDRLGLAPEECLFVDDSRSNIDAARKLNLDVLHYPVFGQIPSELSNL